MTASILLKLMVTIAPARMVKIALDEYPALSDGRSWMKMQIPIVIDPDIT